MARTADPRREAVAALTWALEKMGLCDWDVTLVYDANAPDWVEGGSECLGAVTTCRTSKKATIWCAAEACASRGGTPIAAIMHEVLHVAACDTGIETDADPSDAANEFLWDKISELMEVAYLSLKPKRGKKKS